jgi:hypothetical protein
MLTLTERYGMGEVRISKLMASMPLRFQTKSK